MKKILSSILVLAVLLTANFSTAFAQNQVDIKSGSAWYDRDNSAFGATISVNGCEYFAVEYRMIERNDYGWDIYTMTNNDGDWRYIGVKGDEKHEYSFNNQLQIDVFIAVANKAAQSVGYDHMF